LASYIAQQIVTRALKEAGVLGGASVPEGDQGPDGFDTLNGMIDSMTIDAEYIFCRDISLYALTAGQQEYEIGPTAASPFNVTRPEWIINANIVDANNVRVSHLAVINDDVRMGITVPNLPSSLPAGLNYRATLPNGKLWFVAKPASGYRVELETWQILEQFVDMFTAVDLPRGYYEMLVYRLAQRFCTPAWGKSIDAAIDRLAGEATARVAARNLSPTPNQAVDPRAAGSRQRSDMGVSEYFLDGEYISQMYR